MTFSQNQSTEEKIVTSHVKIYKFIVIIFFIGWLLLGYIANQYKVVDTLNTSVIQDKKENLSNEDIFASKKVQKTMNIIRNNSFGFDKKTNIDIEDAMLKSIVNWLGDKHSTYFTKKETTEFQEALRGDFEWIGAVINENPKGIKIMKIIINSPAEKAWLKAGDIMTRVGDMSIVGKSTEEAVKVIRWPKWSKAEITYKRWEDNTDLHVTVIRDKVNVPSVAEKMLPNNIWYIEVATFGEHTTNEFIKSWNILVSTGAEWIILDFRNNGGGYLDTAVDLASIVLPQNSPVVIIKQNDSKKNEVLLTRARSKSNVSIPIVVLINEFSASASEIFAGALKDHGRALILGDKSYGKGSVQEPFDLGDGSIIKITTARWYTPKDTSIDEKGITPDIWLILTAKDYENIFDRQLKAAEIIIKDQIVSSGSVEQMKEKYKINTFNTLTKE